MESVPCQADDEVAAAFNEIHKLFPDVKASETEIGSVIYAVKPGDGRERAGSIMPARTWRSC